MATTRVKLGSREKDLMLKRSATKDSLLIVDFDSDDACVLPIYLENEKGESFVRAETKEARWAVLRPWREEAK